MFVRSTSVLRPVFRSYALRSFRTGVEFNAPRAYLNKSYVRNYSSESNVPDFSEKLPQGISPTVSRIILPLLDWASSSGRMKEVREELEELRDSMDDPAEYEYFELQVKSGSLSHLSPGTIAAVEELNEHKLLKDIPQLYEAFDHVYCNTSNERSVGVILPAEPSDEEIEVLENELKAFYFKDMNIELNLDISVRSTIGTGRIYCFGDHMLDLTTTDFSKNLKEEYNGPKNELIDRFNQLDELYRRPINADLPSSNTLYKEKWNSYVSKVTKACGLTAE